MLPCRCFVHGALRALSGSGVASETCGVEVGDDHSTAWQDSIGNIPWLGLRLFTAVETLSVSEVWWEVLLLREGVTGEMYALVLPVPRPVLNLLCSENQPVRSMKRFLGVLRDCGRPLIIIDNLSESDEVFDAEVRE